MKYEVKIEICSYKDNGDYDKQIININMPIQKVTKEEILCLFEDVKWEVNKFIK